MFFVFFFFKQKTAYEMRISDWSSDVCSSDLIIPYSRSLDDSASNKVVAHRHCNGIKGNRTPFERWGHEEARWDTIAGQVARLHKSKQWRFGPDAMARVEKDGGLDRKRVVSGKSVSVRVALGGSRIIKQNKK